MKVAVPIREGLFEGEGGEATLVGGKCGSCGQIFFPSRNICPDCLVKESEPVSLGGKGNLYSYSIVNIPADHYEAPYCVAWIELPGGIRVFTQIKDWEDQPLTIGMGMTLQIGTLWEEEDREIIGYFFRPDDGSESSKDVK